MRKLSTARESLTRLEKRIAGLVDPKQRRWLSVYRDHWWNEVIGNVDGVMATMSRGPIRYTFDGHPFMVAKNMAAIETFEDSRRMYEGVAALGVNMAGPVDEERIAFDEQGIIVSCILTTVYPGMLLGALSEPVDPSALCLLRWPNITAIRFDEDGLMMGEDIVNGAPILVRKVDRAVMNALIDGPASGLHL